MTDREADVLEAAWLTSKRRKKPWAWLLSIWSALVMGLAWWAQRQFWSHHGLPMNPAEVTLLSQPLRWFFMQPPSLTATIMIAGIVCPAVVIIREDFWLKKRMLHLTENAPPHQRAGTLRAHRQARLKNVSLADRLIAWAVFIVLTVISVWIPKEFFGKHPPILAIYNMNALACIPSLYAASNFLKWPRFYREDMPRLERWGTWAAIMAFAAVQVVVVHTLLGCFV